MTYALIGLCVLLAGIHLPTLLWVRSVESAKDNLRDRLDATQMLADEYRHARDIEVAAHAVTVDRLATEQTLRAVAEAQRNEAMRRTRTYLTQNLRNGSEKEINDAIVDLFASPLGVVSTQLPHSGSSSAGSDDLEKP